MVPILTTKRLKLRPISPDDIKSIYEYAADKETTKYMGWKTHKSIKDTEEFISFVLEQYKLENYYDWGIEFKEDNRFIGTIGIMDVKNDYAEVGFIINKKYWGMGIIREALKKVLEYGFEKVKLNQVYTRVFEKNINSKKVLERTGFKLDNKPRLKTPKDHPCAEANIYSLAKINWQTKNN